MRRPNWVRLAACASASGLAIASCPAAAQDTDEETIVVTGSRLPTTSAEIVQPVVVLDGDQIETRGYASVGEALEELPVYGTTGSSPIGVQAGAFGTGQTFVNIFGLGDQRTLSLANGRRFVGSNTASPLGQAGAGSQVDLNLMPTLLIDRIETIAVGGAPIYGSDAIAGTVNIVLKRDFEGIALDGQYGISSRGDAPDRRLRGAMGTNFAGGRGNIALSLEYNSTKGLRSSDRPDHRLNSAFVAPGDPTSPFANEYIGDRRIPALSQYGIPQVSNFFFVLSPANAAALGPAFGLPFPYQVGVTDNLADPLSGNPLVFNSDGELIPVDFGVEAGDLVNADGGNGFSLPFGVLSSTRRYVAVALGQYEVTDSVRLFAEGWYANSRATELATQPEYSSILFGQGGADQNLIISLDNPFLSDEARAIIAANLAANPLSDAQDSFGLGRAHVDLTPGVASSTVETYRFVGGFDGTLNALGRELTFELAANYGKSTTEGEGRAIVRQNLLNAVNAVRSGDSIVCAPHASSPMPTLSATCAPFNPFGSQSSQAARDYITAVTDPRSENDQLVLTASLSGALMDLPAGPLRFALGYEHRRETTDFDPGAYYRGGDDPDPATDDNGDGIDDNDRVPFGASVIVDPVSGGFDTDELFAELRIPITGTLEAQGAIRLIDHSLAGTDPTYTIGATWQPVRGLSLRGNFTRSVRAPAIGEYFTPRSSKFTAASDPCDARFLDSGPNPDVRRANCAADNLPADFTSTIVDIGQPSTFSGNPNLRNEKANSWTIGAALRPRFIPRLSLSVDWVDIAVRDAVEDLDATAVLNACYDAEGDSSYCSLFTRDFSTAPGDPFYGQIIGIETGYQNAARRDFDGLVGELAWRVDTPSMGAASSLELDAHYLYIHDLKRRVGVGDLQTLASFLGYSRHQATGSITYRNQGLSWQWQAQYIGKAFNDPDASENAYDFPEADAVVFFNSSLSYQLSDGFRVSFIVDNVFDTKQPFPVPAGGGNVTYFDGILGRYFKFGAGIRF